ncbi:helix-turn-helix domain containing protein [Streptomyces sp. NBC_01242]|nr:helix-turn-helix domain containing protein [Streptomyces sp. NBC_01242]
MIREQQGRTREETAELLKVSSDTVAGWVHCPTCRQPTPWQSYDTT